MPRKRLAGVEEQAGGILKFFRTVSIETALVILALIGDVIKERRAQGQKIRASRGKQVVHQQVGEKLAVVAAKLAQPPANTATPLGAKQVAASVPKPKVKKRQRRRTKAEMQAARAPVQEALPDDGLIVDEQAEFDQYQEV